jgi:hypothetical protein
VKSHCRLGPMGKHRPGRWLPEYPEGLDEVEG